MNARFIIRLLIGSVLFLTSMTLSGQPDEDTYQLENKVYADYIKTVKFHIDGLDLSLPVIDLVNLSPLRLTFDDLSDDVSDYAYTFIHCNADWTRSNLSAMEYTDGYTEGDIETYEFGYNTFTAFTNYTLSFPNRDITLNKSGNYVLVVYNIDTDEVIITRRFAVVEPIMQVVSEIKRPAQVSMIRTHQEIDFQVLHRGINIRSPRTEIKATIIKNNNWDSSIDDIRPVFIKPEKMVFDYQNKIVYPAVNEYRNLNIRTFRSRTESIFEIHDAGSYYDVYLRLDEPRRDLAYNFVRDLNGQFVIENLDFPDPNLESDYANIIFSLKVKRPFYDSDVYIVGLMNDLELKAENLMTYDETNQAYTGKVFLKQGFYNYYYAVVNRTTGEISYEETEGNFGQTENNYTIFLYYTPQGSRYDRLVAVQQATSFR